MNKTRQVRKDKSLTDKKATWFCLFFIQKGIVFLEV